MSIGEREIVSNMSTRGREIVIFSTRGREMSKIRRARSVPI